MEELDFVGPWEVLNMARRFGADANVLLVAERAGAVRCNGGLSVNVDCSFEDCPPLDLILIPGGQGTRTEVDNQSLLDFVRYQAARCAWVTAVCTGAFILERAGLLTTKRATTHWASLDRLRNLATVDVVEDRFVVDGNTITSAGISAGIDMALGWSDVCGARTLRFRRRSRWSITRGHRSAPKKSPPSPHRHTSAGRIQPDAGASYDT